MTVKDAAVVPSDFFIYRKLRQTHNGVSVFLIFYQLRAIRLYIPDNCLESVMHHAFLYKEGT